MTNFSVGVRELGLLLRRLRWGSQEGRGGHTAGSSGLPTVGELLWWVRDEKRQRRALRRQACSLKTNGSISTCGRHHVLQ